jgi:hypothetical protein
LYNNFDRCIDHLLAGKNQLSEEFQQLTIEYAIKHNKTKLLVTLFNRTDLPQNTLAYITKINNPQVLAKFIEKQDLSLYDITDKINSNKKSAVILSALIKKSTDPLYLESLVNDRHKSVIRALLLNKHSPDKVIISTVLALSERSKFQNTRDRIIEIINSREDLLPTLAESSRYKLSRLILYKKPALSNKGYDNLLETLVLVPLNKIISEIPESSYFYKPGFWGESEKLSHLYDVLRNLEILVTYSNFNSAILDKIGLHLDLLFNELNLANIKKIRLFKGTETAYELYKYKNSNLDAIKENNKTHIESEILNFTESDLINQAILNYLENVLSFDLTKVLVGNTNYNYKNVNQVINKILAYEFIKPEIYYKLIDLVEASLQTLDTDEAIIKEYITNIIKLTYKSSNNTILNITKIHDIFIKFEDTFFNSLLSKEVALNNRNINDIISNTTWHKEILSRSNFILLNEILSNKSEYYNEVYEILFDNKVVLDFETISLLSNESDLSITDLVLLSNSLNK